MWESQGKVREFCAECLQYFSIADDTFLFHILVPPMDPGLENPCIFLDAMWCFSSITFSWEENMCVLVTVYWLIIPSLYFASRFTAGFWKIFVSLRGPVLLWSTSWYHTGSSQLVTSVIQQYIYIIYVSLSESMKFIVAMINYISCMLSLAW